MAAYREGPNPLRPYYIPPSIGDAPEPGPGLAASGGAAAPSAAVRTHGYGATPYSQKARDIFADLDYKGYMADPSPSAVQSVRDVVDELMWRYTSVLMAQPFEVAKTILQVRRQDVVAGPASPVSAAVDDTRDARDRDARDKEARDRDRDTRRASHHQGGARSSLGAGGSGGWGEPDLYSGPGYESDPDEPAYFTGSVVSSVRPYGYGGTGRIDVSRMDGMAGMGGLSTIGSSQAPPSPPATATSTSAASARARMAAQAGDDEPASPFVTLAEQQLVLAGRKPDSILEVVGQLWQKEGAWGVWKGTHASFLYNVLQSLLENWSRSLLSALFNVPDLGLKDDVDRLIDLAAPYPWASLCVAAAAAVTAGLVLAPLDLVRTRLIITPTTSRMGRTHTRRAISVLRSLPSLACPALLVVPTVLHALVHPLLTLPAPLVLRTRFGVDRDESPVAFAVAKFASASLALLVKLPLETVLRRGQAHVASTTDYVQAIELGRQDHAAAALLAHNPAAEQPAPVMETIFPIGPYKGVLGTMAHIVNAEGSSVVEPAGGASASSSSSSPRNKKKKKIAETVYRRGQGMEGLWRGWKVSWWGLVGLWAATALQDGDSHQF